jgi:hypothetical protein
MKPTRLHGKPIDDLTREEAIDALRQSISQIKYLESVYTAPLGRISSTAPIYGDDAFDQSAGNRVTTIVGGGGGLGQMPKTAIGNPHLLRSEETKPQREVR